MFVLAWLTCVPSSSPNVFTRMTSSHFAKITCPASRVVAAIGSLKTLPSQALRTALACEASAFDGGTTSRAFKR